MEIVSLPVVLDKSQIDSRFRMVILATERAKQIINGARPTIHSRYLKSTTTALEELAQAQVNYVTGKEARKALQEAVAKKIAVEMKHAGQPGDEDEVKKEIEKDLGVYIPEEGMDESSDE
ncbi:MAG: DNA-directed RNA polymerase subunit omega [Nitrospirae bacterium]|nr:DNA-directed RNA polymerase subunit omega [Nitrospirota bacterium]